MPGQSRGSSRAFWPNRKVGPLFLLPKRSTRCNLVPLEHTILSAYIPPVSVESDEECRVGEKDYRLPPRNSVDIKIRHRPEEGGGEKFIVVRENIHNHMEESPCTHLPHWFSADHPYKKKKGGEDYETVGDVVQTIGIVRDIRMTRAMFRHNLSRATV